MSQPLKKQQVIGLFGQAAGTKLLNWLDPCCDDFCNSVLNCISPFDCSDVSTCLGVSAGGNPNLVYNQVGNWVANGNAIPAGNPTEVQINVAGAFGSSPNFTMNTATGSFSFGAATGASIVANGVGNDLSVAADNDIDIVASNTLDIAANNTLVVSSGNSKVSTLGGERHTLFVVTAAGALNVSVNHYILVINKLVAAATTVNLPAGPTRGDMYIIKDGKGDANANPITVVPAAGTIDGAANNVISNNYGCRIYVYNGTEWNVISNS